MLEGGLADTANKYHCRVSKSCNHAITRLHNIFENLLKFWTKERKTGITGTNFMYLSQFDNLFFSFTCFLMFCVMHVSAQNFQSVHFDAQKNLLVENLRLCGPNNFNV